MTDIKNESDWIKQQGGCCIPDCCATPEHVDDMDNVYCTEHMEQDREEQPDVWSSFFEEVVGEVIMVESAPEKPARLFNTSDLRLKFGHTNQHTLVLPQKRQKHDNKYLMMPLFENRELMIYLKRKQLEQLHRHIGGMLGLEDKS